MTVMESFLLATGTRDSPQSLHSAQSVVRETTVKAAWVDECGKVRLCLSVVGIFVLSVAVG